jgi:alkylhydroperoxidase/carboxymuconolactone decarboxylase family protein YurZ
MATAEQQRLRDEFVTRRGYWSPLLESLLEVDPAFFEQYLELATVPWRHGSLEPKVKEFVYIAIDAAATGLYEPGLRAHIRAALQYGATKEELLEVFQLTATLGIHACTVGVPVLLDALGPDRGRAPLSERQEEIKAEFEAKRGYWNPFWDGLLELDAEFFAAYTGFSGHPWVHGVLEPKVKELIYTAFDCAATHMYVPGLRQHVENALGYGATPAEVMEVFELATTLGMHTFTSGLPILLEELERAEAEASR